MDKQQAANDFFNTISEKWDTAHNRGYWRAGWEAHETQSLAHVAHIEHTIEPNWQEELAELRARPATDPYQIAIAKIFDLMMGVADEQLKSVLCMAFWKHAIEPLVKAVAASQAQESWPKFKDIKQVFPENEETPAPQPAGPVEQDKNFTVRLKAIINRLLEESGTFSMCEEQTNPPLAAFYKLLETVKLEDINKPTGTLQNQAGPVWVKATERLPITEGQYCIKANGKFWNAEWEGELFGFKIYGWAINSTGWGRANNSIIQWLDESNTQQVFTREHIPAIFEAYSRYRNGEGDKEFTEWFNTNYPLK